MSLNRKITKCIEILTRKGYTVYRRKKNEKNLKKHKISPKLKMTSQKTKEWGLLAYFKKDPLKILEKNNDDIKIINIQTGTDNGGKTYYVDAHIKCSKRKKIKEWLDKAGKYKIQELNKINEDDKDTITTDKIEIPKKGAMKFFKKKRKDWKLKNVTPEEWMAYIIKILDDEIKVSGDSFTFKVKGDEVEDFEDNFEEEIEKENLYNELIPVSSNIRRKSNEDFNHTEEEENMGIIFLLYMDKFFGYNTEEGSGIIGIKFKDYLRLNPKIDEKKYPNTYKLYREFMGF